MDMLQQFRNSYQLLRGGNLIIVALTMYFFQYFVLKPEFDLIPLTPSLDQQLMLFLTLGVVFITAAGYVINDFFDFETDKLFKPERNVLGVWISLDGAFNLQLALNLIGIALCYYVGWKLGNYQLGNYALFAVMLLIIYSMFLKKYFLIGNIVVAALSSYVLVIIFIYEYKFFYPEYSLGNEEHMRRVIYQMLGYTFFAFLVSLIREICKDAEDKEGDRSAGLKTLPILLSVRTTNIIIALLTVFLMVCLARVQCQFYLDGKLKQFWYILLFIQVTLVINLITLFSTKSKEDYHNLSVFMKLVMLLGVFSMPLFYLFNRLS